MTFTNLDNSEEISQIDYINPKARYKKNCH